MPNEMILRSPGAPPPPPQRAAAAPVPPRVTASSAGPRGPIKGKSNFQTEGGAFGSRVNMAGGSPWQNANVRPEPAPAAPPPRAPQAAVASVVPPQAQGAGPELVYARPVMGKSELPEPPDVVNLLEAASSLSGSEQVAEDPQPAHGEATLGAATDYSGSIALAVVLLGVVAVGAYFLIDSSGKNK